ncbi:MAG: hypothetical protein R3Y63_05300 [Eubacteriales bacterium]
MKQFILGTLILALLSSCNSGNTIEEVPNPESTQPIATSAPQEEETENTCSCETPCPCSTCEEEEDACPENSLLPDPSIGQGLPSGAVPWVDEGQPHSSEAVPSIGEATTGHNPNYSQWTNWNGVAR